MNFPLQYALVISFCIATASFVFADDANAPNEKAHTHVTITIIAGTVTKVNTEKKLFEIKMADEKTATFTVGESTRFRKDGALMPLENLAVGNYVRFLLRERNDGSVAPGQVFVLGKPPATEEKPTVKEEPPPRSEP